MERTIMLKISSQTFPTAGAYGAVSGAAAQWCEVGGATLPPSLRRYLARTFVVQTPELHHPQGQKVVADPAGTLS